MSRERRTKAPIGRRKVDRSLRAAFRRHDRLLKKVAEVVRQLRRERDRFERELILAQLENEKLKSRNGLFVAWSNPDRADRGDTCS